MSINANCSVRKVAFKVVRNAKSHSFPEWNCKIALDKLNNKHAQHTVSLPFKLKSEFHNKLDSIEKDPHEWISYLEGLRIWMNKFGFKGNNNNGDFIIHTISYLRNMILSWMEWKIISHQAALMHQLLRSFEKCLIIDMNKLRIHTKKRKKKKLH